jgi:hypothetical protein
MTGLNAFAAFALLAGLTLSACSPAPTETAPAQDPASFEGAWRGTLSLGPQSIRLELVLAPGAEGMEGVLVSLDQGGGEIPLSELEIEGAAIRFAANPPGLTYEGALEGEQITGRFRQNVLNTELNFERGRFEDEAPQPTAGPELDENERAVTVQSGDVSLAGTLRLPAGAGAFPGVVILSGSGSQDRDGTFGELRIYAALAEALANEGLASLRLDDRGVGSSSGPAPRAPADLAMDAAAALAVLSAQPQVSCTGFAGHSEGGLIALLAAPAAEPAFIVSLAGMHMGIEDTLRGQAEALIRASGGGDAAVAQNRVMQEAMFDVLRTADGGADTREALQAALLAVGAPEGQARQQAAIWGQPYASASFAVDPVEASAGYEGPLLGVFGEFDLQVLPGPQSEALMAARGAAPTQVLILPGINHLFQETQTGAMSEYGSAEHPISQSALSAIATGAAALAASACAD